MDVSLPVEIPGATTHPNDLHTSDVEWAGLGLQINGRAGNTDMSNCVAAAMAMMLAVLVLHLRLSMFSVVSPRTPCIYILRLYLALPFAGVVAPSVLSASV